MTATLDLSPDEESSDRGPVDDAERIEFLRSSLIGVARAIEDGADVRSQDVEKLARELTQQICKAIREGHGDAVPGETKMAREYKAERDEARVALEAARERASAVADELLEARAEVERLTAYLNEIQLDDYRKRAARKDWGRIS